MKRKWLLIPVVVVVLLAGVPLVGGALMSLRRDITVTAHFRQPPEALYQALVDFATWPAWYAPAKTSTRMEDRDGRQVWKMETEWGAFLNEVVDMKPPAGEQPGTITTRVADPASPVQGGWEWTIAAAQGGSDVKLTDHGRIANPFLRFMMWRLVGPKATILPAVTGLGRRFGEDVVCTVQVAEVR